MVAAAPMPALRRPWEDALLADPRLLATMADVVGGPFHVVHPETFGENLDAFDAVFRGLGVPGLIRFGSKANKARAFVSACADAAARAGDPGRFGVDAASAGEFTAALGAGVRGEEIVVTGPMPSAQVLHLARRHRALVAVDTRTTALALADRPSDEPLQILLRLRPRSGTSRFGHTDADVTEVLDRLRGAPHLQLRGFSFHLSGYDVEPRAAMAHRAIDWCERARDDGFDRVDTVSIGGGFPISYVSELDWMRYRDNEIGDWYIDRRVPGSLYPYANSPSGPAALTSILTAPADTSPASVADRAGAQGIGIMIEPGRALCAGAGSSVFPVRAVHGLPDGRAVVTVDGTSLSLSEQWFDSEYLPDPVLWHRDRALGEDVDHDAVPFAAAVAGGTCLDSDFLSRRLIAFPGAPGPDDLLVYPNTAGYQMDSNESEFHRTPAPPKIVLRGSTPDHLMWSLER